MQKQNIIFRLINTFLIFNLFSSQLKTRVLYIKVSLIAKKSHLFL